MLLLALSTTYNDPHGNGEAFLFSTWPAEAGFRAWRWSGANRFFQAAAVDFVAFGSGGHFGLWVGRSIGTGSTAACATFENEPLTEHSVAGGLEEPPLLSPFRVEVDELWRTLFLDFGGCGSGSRECLRSCSPPTRRRTT